jgi:hypothetical protein
MDPHFHDISISLYRQGGDGGSAFLVHTYSRKHGAPYRMVAVAEAMQTLGGLESAADGLLRFPCEAAHVMACKRAFLEACKLDPGSAAAPRPLQTIDKKSGRTITATGVGDGVYEISADGEAEGREKRVSAIAGGLMKLGEMEAVGAAGDRVRFPCRQDHDALVGLLLVRAPNVRAVLREQEQSSSRGVLAAPSQQK